MKHRSVILMAVLVLAFCAGLQAQTSCSQANLTGTYLGSFKGWVTIGVANGFPVFAPAVGVGTFTADSAGAFAGTWDSALAGAADSSNFTGTATVTRECKVTVKATCPTGCAVTLTGVFVHPGSMTGYSSKEVYLIYTSQTVQGSPVPLTGTMELKQIGN
jgi:hypothetical protein